MEEEKIDVEMTESRDVGDDVKEIKADLTIIRMELAEIRAAFFNLANEMRQMHQVQKTQHADFNTGITACQQAFYRCKAGYDSISEAYEAIHDGIDSAAGMITDGYNQT